MQKEIPFSFLEVERNNITSITEEAGMLIEKGVTSYSPLSAPRQEGCLRP
jgi:hypothetical protein